MKHVGHRDMRAAAPPPSSAERPNLRIQGNGESGGGSFGVVRVTGTADIHGDVECKTLKVMGTCRVRGNLRAGHVRVMGTLQVEGRMSANHVKMMGELWVRGDCSAEAFHMRGAFTVDGLLNTERAWVRLHGPAAAREIGGAYIRVRPPRWPGRAQGALSAELIEGDVLELEAVRADVIRGNRVTVGAGCDVRRVEYTDALHRSPRSRIGDAVHTPRE